MFIIGGQGWEPYHSRASSNLLLPLGGASLEERLPGKTGLLGGWWRREDIAHQAAPPSSRLRTWPGLCLCSALCRNQVGREKKIMISVACPHRALKTVGDSLLAHEKWRQNREALPCSQDWKDTLREFHQGGMVKVDMEETGPPKDVRERGTNGAWWRRLWEQCTEWAGSQQRPGVSQWHMHICMFPSPIPLQRVFAPYIFTQQCILEKRHISTYKGPLFSLMDG